MLLITNRNGELSHLACVLSDFSLCQREHLPEIISHVKKSIKALLSGDLKEVSLQYSLKQTLCDGNKV